MSILTVSKVNNIKRPQLGMSAMSWPTARWSYPVTFFALIAICFLNRIPLVDSLSCVFRRLMRISAAMPRLLTLLKVMTATIVCCRNITEFNKPSCDYFLTG